MMEMKVMWVETLAYSLDSLMDMHRLRKATVGPMRVVKQIKMNFILTCYTQLYLFGLS